MENTHLTERQKVLEIYNLIGSRGLFVSSNYDVFTHPPQEAGFGTAYRLPLITEGKAYYSPLLFATLTSLLNHGTMLFTGAPGIGKTTGGEFAGHFFTGTPLEDILAAEIQGHPQLTEEKMIACLDIGALVQPGGKRIVIPQKFLKCPVKVIDEVNRLPPDTASILMRLVDTGLAVYQGEVLKAEPGPLFVTANYADEGTFQLTPPFLDRIDAAVMVTSPPQWDLRAIRERGDEKLNGNLQELLKVPEYLKLDINKIRKEINQMPEAQENGVQIVSSFVDFLYGSLRFSEAASTNLSRATKGNAWYSNQDKAKPGHFQGSPHAYTLNELSMRTVKAIDRYAKAYAWINGREKVELADLKAILPYLLWHKIHPAQKAFAENETFANDRILFIEELIKKVETEYAELNSDTNIGNYHAALNVIKGEISVPDKEKRRQIVANAISALGRIDKPYAISLAQHLASEYNRRCIEQNTNPK